MSGFSIMRLLFIVFQLTGFCMHMLAQSPGVFLKNYTPSSGSSIFNTLLPLEDGGFLLAGSCPDSLGFTDALIVRTDASGNAIWSKKYGKKGFSEEIREARKHPNGGFALTGFLERRVGQFQNIMEDMLLIRLGSNGEMLWTKSVGDDDDDEQANALKVDASGYFLWEEHFLIRQATWRPAFSGSIVQEITFRIIW